MCGICFIKKCKKPTANESQPQHPGMPVYEDVLLTDTKQREQTLELKQNIAYGPIVWP